MTHPAHSALLLSLLLALPAQRDNPKATIVDLDDRLANIGHKQ